MLQTFKNGQGSIVLRVKLLDSSSITGAGLTGLSSSSTGLIISTIADNEAAATIYTQAGSTVETITTLGTYAAPTATKCRFKEVDATNHKGIYEIHLADARYAVANAKSLLVSLLGVTNLKQEDFIIQLQSDDPFVAKPANFASFSIDANGRIDLAKWLGSAPDALSSGKVPTDVKLWLAAAPDVLSSGKIAADIKLWLAAAPDALSSGKVPADIKLWLAAAPDALSSGKVPADLKLWLTSAPASLSTNGYVKTLLMRWLTDDAPGTPGALTSNGNVPSSVKEWITTLLTEGAAGRFIAGMKQFFDIASPTSTMNLLTKVTDLTNLPAVPTDWMTAAGVKSDAVTKIQGNLATAANVTAAGNAILAVLGSPSVSLQADIASIYAIVNSGSYGNSALLSALQNIQNNTFISSNIPITLERPDSGSVTVGITILFCDETGAAKNLDSGNPAITVVNDAAGNLSARLGSISNPATGKYILNYTSSASDAIEGVHWEITGTVNSKLRRYVAYMQIVDTTAVDFTSTDRANMETILSRISGAVALESSLQGLITTVGVAGAGLTAADDAVISAIAALYNISPAQVRTAVGLNEANLDTQLSTISGKTANLPSAPASTSDVTGARDSVTAKMLKYFKLTLRKDATVVSENATELADINANTGGGSGSANPQTDSLEALRDRGDSSWLTATGFSTLTATDVRTALGLDAADLDTQLAALLTAIGTRLSAEAFTAASQAELIAAIKGVTDQLRFTTANKVDSSTSFTLTDEQIVAMARIIGPLIWNNPDRRLTYPAGGTPPPGEGPDINVTVATDWVFDITNMGNIEGRTRLLFTAKQSLSDSDAKSYLQVEETAGLLYIGGAAAEAGDGTLTVLDAVRGNLRGRIKAESTQALKAANCIYDAKYQNTAGDWVPLPSGKFIAHPIVTRTI